MNHLASSLLAVAALSAAPAKQTFTGTITESNSTLVAKGFPKRILIGVRNPFGAYRGLIATRSRDYLRIGNGSAMSDVIIRAETAADHSMIRQMNEAAFGGADQTDLVESLRTEGVAPTNERSPRSVRAVVFRGFPSPIGVLLQIATL